MLPKKIIKKILIDQDLTQVDLARKIGRSPEGVNIAIAGKRLFRPTRAMIADALGLPYHELWTDEKVTNPDAQ